MLTRNQEKEIKKLDTKNGRTKSGLCLVEGEKSIITAGDAILYTFTPADTDAFDKLMTTKTPQAIAGVAKIPEFALDTVLAMDKVIILDGIQDPGNMGSIMRLALGFSAGLILHNSADPTNPKVIRSSTGAIFTTPWIKLDNEEIKKIIASDNRPIYKLENKENTKPLNDIPKSDLSKSIIIAGSEGSGIHLDTPGTSLAILHSDKLESLNVTHALAITLYTAQ